MRPTTGAGHLVAGVLSTAVVGLAVVAGAAAAVGTWTDVSPSVSPPGRYFAVMAAEGDGDVVLFGGNGASGPLADTWVWSGSQWSQPAVAGGPGNRSAAAFATAANGEVVLFGGIRYTPPDPPVFFDDTWIWDGTTWTEASPAVSPPARWAATMALDAAGQIVLFGGSGETDNLDDTWLWDGSTWTEASPATSPPARNNAATATDGSGNVVLFGGAAYPTAYADTWIWDGATWTDATPATSPPALAGATMAADADGNVVLFGGSGSTGFTSDTWQWDGSTWSLVDTTTSPSVRANASMATDPSGKLVLFGGCCDAGSGYADTWLLDVGSEPDADGDGLPDSTDACPLSDLDPTVVIGGSDTGAGNDLLPDGCTVQDLVDRAAASAQTHGAFVAAVVTTVQTLQGDGVLTRREAASIIAAAGKAPIP